MNWLDWVLVAMVGASVLTGLFKGAVRTVFSLAGLAIGFFVASRESGALALVLGRWMSDKVAGAVAFILIFLGIGLAFALVGWLLRRAIEKLSLTWLDRVAGAALGLLRGVAIVGVLALAIEGLGGLRATRTATTYPYALRAGWVLLQLVPDEAKRRLNWEALQARIPEKLRAMHAARDVI